jgi:aspartate/methionine/tyrosine aminotransferase
MYWKKLLVRAGLARFVPSIQRDADGGHDFMKYYSSSILAGPVAELRSLAKYWQAADEGDRIDLASGVPLFDVTPSTGTKLPLARRGYPPAWGWPELRSLIAEKLQAEQQLHVNPVDEVLITNGVTGAFSTVLDTFVQRGDRVVLFDPSSPLYRLTLAPRRIRLHWLSATTEGGFFRFRHDALARAMKTARLLVINVPANPTGASLAPEDVEELLWWAERHDVLIFYDQAFARFQYDHALPGLATAVKGHRRTLTAGSVSKGHALASARVGWLAGHRNLVRACALGQLLHTPFVPAVAQQIALTALQQPDSSFQPIHAQFKTRRRYIHERLNAMGLTAAWPAGGFFFWIDVASTGLTGRQFADRLLQDHRVLVCPGEFFGPSSASFVRLSFAAEDGRLQEGLTRLSNLVRTLKDPAEPLKKAA